MRNPTGKKLEKIIFKLFDDASQGVDRYNHNGSLWAIFTNENKWVVEFTKDQTLWYNYNFFKDEMELIGLDCVEDKDLIQKWFESRFLGIPKVEEAFDPFFDQDQYVEDTIQNGVKHTQDNNLSESESVEDTIQNGVKDISSVLYKELLSVEDTIQNGVKDTKASHFAINEIVEDTIKTGVKETYSTLRRTKLGVDDIIQNGVKYTFQTSVNDLIELEDIIQNGVKETKSMCGKRNGRVDNIVQNGVKHTEDGDWLDQDERITDIIEDGVKEIREVTFLNQMFIEETIQDGVKEIQPLPAQDGNRDWGLYYHRQEDRTKPHTEYVKEVIEDSYNHMGRVEGVIRNTDKDGI